MDTDALRKTAEYLSQYKLKITEYKVGDTFLYMGIRMIVTGIDDRNLHCDYVDNIGKIQTKTFVYDMVDFLNSKEQTLEEFTQDIEKCKAMAQGLPECLKGEPKP